MTRFHVKDRIYDRGLTLCAVMFLAIGLFWQSWLGDLLPRYEGRIAPVTTKLTLTSLRPTPGGLWIEGEILKLRACTFDRITWSSGPGKGARIYQLSTVPARNYPDGVTISIGPVFLPVTVDELQTETRGTLWHDCPGWWRRWQTATPYWDPQAISLDIIGGQDK